MDILEKSSLVMGGYLDSIPCVGIGPGWPKDGVRWKYSSKIPLLGKKLNGLIYKSTRYLYRKKWVENLAESLKTGYRLLDYSSAYGDGSMIGDAIRKSGVSRKELFLTTRVSNWAQREHKVREEFLHCLRGFGTGYVDLLQFHWPVTGLYLDTWREMEKLKGDGLVKHIGVANCHQHHLEEIFKICKYRPEIGQFEIHPLFTQKPLIQYYKDHGIIVEAYTPIARYDDRLVRLPLLKHLEQKYGKTFIQIILRWHVQNECIPIVRSLNPKHQKENLDIFDFELSAEDMKAIDSININSRLRYDPDNCDFSIL